MHVEHSWADAPVMAHAWEWVLCHEHMSECYEPSGALKGSKPAEAQGVCVCVRVCVRVHVRVRALVCVCVRARSSEPASEDRCFECARPGELLTDRRPVPPFPAPLTAAASLPASPQLHSRAPSAASSAGHSASPVGYPQVCETSSVLSGKGPLDTQKTPLPMHG